MLKKTIKKSASKKHRIPPKKRPKKLLAPEDKRNKLIQAKTTAKQKETITAKAKSLGMSVSDFILARCLDYEPKALLTPVQLELLQELPNIRADLANVVNSLGTLSPDDKIRHFQDFAFMQAYIDATRIERERISKLLDALNNSNDFDVLHQTPTITQSTTT